MRYHVGVVFDHQVGLTMRHPVDLHVGARIRRRRWLVGLTQQKLAEQVGIKFQQIQKYETGMNRVSASRLWEIAEVLGVPVAHFFEGYACEAEDQTGARLPADILAEKDALDLLRTFYDLPEDARKHLFEFAGGLSKGSAA